MDSVLGARLSKARAQAGLNKNQLARAVGTSWQHVDHWERGRRRPSYESLRRIGEALGVSIDYLLGLSEARGGAIDRYLSELAPPDLSADEEAWLRSAPLRDPDADPRVYAELLERVRRAPSVPRSGVRARVSSAELHDAIARRKPVR